MKEEKEEEAGGRGLAVKRAPPPATRTARAAGTRSTSLSLLLLLLLSMASCGCAEPEPEPEPEEVDAGVLRRLLLSSSSPPSEGERDRGRGRGRGRGARCLVLDCRPFLAHSAGHIRGALHVRCNTIVRRRAKGAVSLEQILPGGEAEAEGQAREALRRGLYAAVVLYDQRGRDRDRDKDGPPQGAGGALALVLQALRREAGPAPPPDIRLLKGGYERFHSEYPEFCSKTKSPAAAAAVSTLASVEHPELSCSSCGTPQHDQGGPVEILPFLFLGSAHHASRRDMLDALGITALLNVSSDCPNHFEGHFQYKCIPVEDNHKTDISSWFMEAIEYIDSVKVRHGRVLVHCQAGISRSATICLAYLIMRKRVKLEEAFEFVKQRRSIISPNFSFMGQLLQFESQVLATSCAAEAASPSGTLRERGKATSTPTSQFVFSFPVSVAVHSTPGSLPYLHSPITTSPTC